MTFGLYTKGDYSQMIVSSEANTLAFVGKATFGARSGITGSGFGPYYYNNFGTILYNWPQSSIYSYTFNAGGRDVVFFVYAPYPQKCSLISASKAVGGTYTIFIASQPAGSTSFIPTVYCFAKTNTATTSGYGMNVFKADGSVAFTTSEKVLIVKKYYNATFPASNILARTGSPGSITYVGNGASQSSATISYISPTDAISQTITKPILYLPSYQTAGAASTGGQYFFYELLGSYNSSTTNLELEWVNTDFGSFGFGGVTYQTNSRNGFAMIADGADYD